MTNLNDYEPTAEYPSRKAKLEKFISKPDNQAAIKRYRPKYEHDEIQFQFLKQLRKAKGLSQAELAVRLGVGQPAISELENRKDLLVSTLVRYLNSSGIALQATWRDDSGTEMVFDLAQLGEEQVSGQSRPELV